MRLILSSGCEKNSDIKGYTVVLFDERVKLTETVVGLEQSEKIEREEKRVFFWFGRSVSVENLHLKVNFGANVDVGRMF